MNPPVRSNGDESRFKGRDWRRIQVSELVEPTEVRFVEFATSIEDTTKLLIKSGAPNVVLVRESTKTRTAIVTFDYSDLNAYLLLVLGLTVPDEKAGQLADRARAGDAIPLKDLLDHLGVKELPTFLPHTADLTRAMEVLGGGSHRLIICKEGTSEVIGVLSQLRLVRFFWENHQNFAATEALYALSLKELKLGGQQVLSINGDRPLKDALQLMNEEGITSLPVLDNHKNVVGNISHVDVRVSQIRSESRRSAALTQIRDSSSQIHPPSLFLPQAAFTSFPSSCPNAALPTAKTLSQSSTSLHSAPSPILSPSSAQHALTVCGSSTRHRPHLRSHQVPDFLQSRHHLRLLRHKHGQSRIPRAPTLQMARRSLAPTPARRFQPPSCQVRP